MIGGRNCRAQVESAAANEVEDLPILYSPSSRGILLKSVGTRRECFAEAADSRSSDARLSQDLAQLIPSLEMACRQKLTRSKTDRRNAA
jgi:hypothetical protein